MKKSLFIVLAAFMALVGCKKQEAENALSSTTTTFRVAAQAPRRAAADKDGQAAKVNRFIMQVEDQTNPANNTTIINDASKITRDASGIVSTQFDVNLVFGHKYNFLFWADNSDVDAYDVTDLNNVTVNLNNGAYTANLDARDAFSAAVMDTVITTNFTKDITLTRPFAQLNLRATDLQALSDEEISQMANMTMTYQAPTSFNVATGLASAPAAIQADFANIYATLDDTTTVTMDYIFASKGEQDLIDFAFAIPALNYTRDFTNVPVERNYRTNLIGALFTLQGQFNVVIDQNWYTPEISNTFLVNGMPAFGTLAEIIANGGNNLTIQLSEDIAQDGIVAQDGQNITIDFNGYSFDVTGLVGSSNTKTNGMQLLQGANVVLKNGTLSSATAKMLIQNYANLTLENMTIDGTQLVDASYGYNYVVSNNCGNVVFAGTTTINGNSNDVAFDVCKFGSYAAPSVTVADAQVTINGKVECTGGKLNITAGTFNGAITTDAGYTAGDIVIRGGKFVADPTAYVPEGYKVSEEAGMFVVNEIGFFADAEGVYHILNAYGLEDFSAAVNGGNTFNGKTVVLDKDIDMTDVNHTPIGGLVSYPSVTFDGIFDGKNHVISNMTTSDNTANYACAGLFGSLLGGIVKNVTLKNVNITSTHYAGGICAYSSSSTTQIENCHVIGGAITSAPELIGSEYDNGDKVGGILGIDSESGVIKDCTVEGLTIIAYRDLGGIAGATNAAITGCTVTNTTIIQDNTNGYKTGINTYHEILGRDLGATMSDNTFVNVTLQTK